MSDAELAINGGTPVRTARFPTVADVSGRDLGEEEIEHLIAVIRSGRLGRAGGEKVAAAESEFRNQYGVRDAHAVTSGTAALHAAVAALRLDVGSEIVTTTVTDMGTVIAILMQNCIPTFADVHPRTMFMTPESVAEQITEKTRAMIVVHLFGQPADMDALMDIAREHDLYVIEDCAQAHGAEDRGRKVGTMGHMGCFSLQQSKQITTGDGGMVITNDDELARHVRLFSDKYYGREPDDPEDIPRLGINYRMTELQGAVALAQIRKLPSILERRRRTAEYLTGVIETIDGIDPPYMRDDVRHAYWRYPFSLDHDVLDCTVEEFGRAIRAEGIPFATGYARGRPIFEAGVLANKRAYGSGQCPWSCPHGRMVEYRTEDYPNTVWGQENVFSTSWNEGITEQDVEDIAAGLRKVADHYRR